MEVHGQLEQVSFENQRCLLDQCLERPGSHFSAMGGSRDWPVSRRLFLKPPAVFLRLSGVPSLGRGAWIPISLLRACVTLGELPRVSEA